MKRTSRAIAAITNCILGVIIAVVGVICFLPRAESVAGLKENVYYRGSSEDGVSLMINVYWGTKEVYGILDVLDEYEAKATFFIGGSWADDNVDCLKEISARGHELGSHGYFHRDQDKLDYAANYQEIKTSVDYISKAAGAEIKLFAPPSGAYNDDTIKAALALNLKTVMWSKDTIDWRDKNKEDCFRRATKDAKGGDLILMHPMAHTLEALPSILQYYRDNGLKPITVGENLGG